jgi:hypothetical protein
MGESNAESALRQERINEDFKNMRDKQRKKRDKGLTAPNTPTNTKEELTNNVQEITLQTDYNLYPNQDQSLQNQPLLFIYDTGAAISMISSEPSWAWTNLRECMYNIGGCFSGPTFKDLQVGEYHGALTLDTGETVRIIIPEAVQIPAHLSHSNLLANTPYLMAGHKFLSDLHKPKLKFKGGGQHTLTVNKGHNIFHVLSLSPTKETNHRTIYLHLDQPYDPPTFVNETHYQQMNRANLHTPTAFIWHLRYACKSAEVLKHTQRHVEGLSA